MDSKIAESGILIADDHPLFRNGMRALLEAEPDTEVAGEATTGEEAIELAAKIPGAKFGSVEIRPIYEWE